MGSVTYGVLIGGIYVKKAISIGETDIEWFIELFNLFAQDMNNLAHEKGWWDSERSDGEAIALMHSELSDCLEAFREGNPSDHNIMHRTSAEIELADCIIRIMDFAVQKGFNLGGAIIDKHQFNKTRSKKHNKLF